MGFEAVLRMVPHLDLNNSIIFVTKIIWGLDTLKADFAQLQLEIAGFVLEKYVDKIRIVLQNSSSIIFFQAQLLILVKLIILHSQRRQGPLGDVLPEQMNKIGLSLLGISDEISRQHKFTSTQFEKDDVVDEVAKELFLTAFHLKSPRLGFSVVRATHLYLNIAKQPLLMKESDYLDFEKVFLEAIGVGLKEFLSFGVGIIVHYTKFSSKPSFPENPRFIFLEPTTLFRDSQVSPDILTRIFSVLSDDLEGFEKRLKGQTRRELTHDFLDFKTTPLLKLENGLYLPLSLTFLLERITTGAYWIIFDYLKKKSKAEHDKFMGFHGKLFQIYIEEIMKEILKRTPASSFDIHVDILYEVKKEEHRSTDLIIRKGDALFLFEVSATRLQAKRTTGQGEEESLTNDIEKIVLHNARTMQKCISNIKQGYLQLGNLDASKIKTFYPIIVTLEGLPRHPAVQMFISKKLREEDVFVSQDIAPLALIDASDLEEVEGYTQDDFFQIFLSWIKDNLFDQYSLADFVKRKYPPIDLRSDWQKGITDQIFNESTMLFFGKPLPSLENKAN